MTALKNIQGRLSSLKKILLPVVFFLQQSLFAQNISPRLDSLVHYCSQHFFFEGVVAVADHDQIIYTKAVGDANKEWNIKNTADTKFRLGSISKQFAAYVLFTLEQEGKIHWQDKLCQYLPQFCSGEKANITISNLLHHTSGLHELTALNNFDEKAFYSKDSLVAMIAKTPLDFLPGDHYAYSNSNFYLAGIIAEKLTGISYGSLLHQRILVPAGMNNTGLDHEGLILSKRSTAYLHEKEKSYKAGYLNMEIPFSAGGMYSTASDLLKWSRFFQKQLSINASLRRLLATSVAGSDTNLYSAGWCILPNEILHTGHINGFANLISIDTLHHRTIIILSNSNFNKLYVLQETIVSILNKNKDALQWTAGKLNEGSLNEYIGTYQNNNLAVTVKNENGKLISYVNGRPLQLLPLRKDVFFANEIDGDLIVERNENNKIVSVKSFEDYSFVRLKKIK